MVNSQVFLADNDYKQSSIGNILVRDWYLYVNPTQPLPYFASEFLLATLIAHLPPL
jgi:hypothetical protein